MADYDQGDWGTGLRALGGAVAVARGMQNLWDAPLESENKELRGLVLRRELEGPSPREKFAFEQEREQRSRRDEQAKIVMTAFSEMAKTASPADSKLLEEHFNRFHALLTPAEQEATRMIYNNSMLNPMRKKGEWFDEMIPGGPPKVTADPTKDIYGYSVQMQNMKEYQRRKTGYMTGQVPAQEKLYGIAEGIFNYVTDDGKLQVLSSADLKFDQIAKEHGTTTGALLASGGVVEGKEHEISVDGNIFKTRTRFNALEGKRLPDEVIPVKGAGVSGQVEEKIRDFSAAFSNRDDSGKTDGSKMYLKLMRWLDESMPLKEVVKRLQYDFPGYNFAFVDPGDFDSWTKWGGYAPSDTQTLIHWKGERVGVFTKDNEPLEYYYDHSSQPPRVYDRMGRVVANDLRAWRDFIGGKTEGEVRGEAKGATSGTVPVGDKQSSRQTPRGDEVLKNLKKFYPEEWTKFVEPIVKQQDKQLNEDQLKVIEELKKVWK